VQVFRNRPVWEKLMVRAMAQDFSWGQSAQEYVNMYEKILAQKRNAAPKP